MADLGGFDLGILKSERQNKQSGLFSMAVPRSDSSNAILMDLMGTERKITLEGIKIGTPEELKSFIETIDDFLNGQQVSRTYSGTLISSKNVLIESFDFVYSEGSPERVAYTLNLIEGTAIS
jgi:hypothetical protein